MNFYKPKLSRPLIQSVHMYIPVSWVFSSRSFVRGPQVLLLLRTRHQVVHTSCSETSSTTTSFFTGIRFYRGKIYETTRYFDPQHLRNAFSRCHGQSIVVSCNNFRLNSTNVKLKMTNTWSGFVIVNWWERAGRGYRYITTALFVPNSRPGSGTRFHILSHPKWQ